jgi:exodeoxyribonuclease VII large subunit
LKRGLERRSDLARIAFVGATARLGPALLLRPLERQRDRLAAVRLSPAPLERRVAEGKTRLSGLERLLGSLHPEAPLARGFARVTSADGKTIGSSEAARAAHALRIRFVDGEVGVSVDGEGISVPKLTQTRTKPPAGQHDLFGDS